MIQLNFPNPIHTAGDLFDRSYELMSTQQESGLLNQSVVIFGERRIGKTSLLNVIIEWARNSQQFIALRLPSIYTREDLMAEIVTMVRNEVEANLGIEPPSDVGSDFLPTTVAAFEHTLNTMLALFPGRQFLLCLDELDSALLNAEENDRTRIMDLLQRLVESDSPIRFVFTMTRVIEAIRTSYTSPFLSKMRKLPLAPWSRNESYNFVNWLAQGQLVFDELAHVTIFEGGGGHPYLTKAILQELVSTCLRDSGMAHITAREARAAVQAASQSAELTFNFDNWREAQFSIEEFRILTRLAVASGPLAIGALCTDASPEVVVKELVRRAYIKVDEATGTCSHRYGVLRTWLQNRAE